LNQSTVNVAGFVREKIPNWQDATRQQREAAVSWATKRYALHVERMYPPDFVSELAKVLRHAVPGSLDDVAVAVLLKEVARRVWETPPTNPRWG
jgi:hypothetical protein